MQPLVSCVAVRQLNEMMIQSKKYKIRISKEELLKRLKDKLRLPAEDIWYHPFMNKRCEWITGKINSSFSLCDYRFYKNGISFNGNIVEINDEVEVKIKTKFKASFIFIQSFFTMLFLLGIILNENIYLSLFLLLLWLSGAISLYFRINSIVKSFYDFFESLFNQREILIQEKTFPI